MLLLKAILITSLGLIFYQDLKERQVFWFLFPTFALCSATVFYQNTLPELFYISIGMNFIFVTILLLIVFLYIKIKLKSSFKEAFGLGDVLMLLGLVFSFSTVSFLIIFVFSLLFSLVMHLVIKKYTRFQTVPLAGYISLFFVIAYMADWFGITLSLYAL